MRAFDRLFDKLIREGELTFITADGKTHRFGKPSPDRAPIVVRLTDPRTPLRILLNPSLGAGEAYMDGTFVMEQGDILDLIDLITWNARYEIFGERTELEARIRPPEWLASWLRKRNHERASRRNVAHHYDLSAKLYDLFLDKDRQYSCAYWTGDPATESLDQAQTDKKAHIVAKLAIGPGHKVLDIGCGWGGMALYIHQKTGADVLGITLSEEQLKIARRRAEQAGVADKVRFELTDYRTVQGPFDRIVSVGMYEHVGPAHFSTFAAKCRSLLAPDGVMLLHTIGRIGPKRSADKWTTKYIFPGGYIPTLSEICEAAEHNGLLTADVETLRLHYAYTLEQWLRRTQAHQAEIVAMYDERFYRMWEFYLAGALTGFTNGEMVNFQVQYVRSRRALPITRDYMIAEEQALLDVPHPPSPHMAEMAGKEFERAGE
ncbi:cyclopropane-fatty-acyl-phospholipid synthase [Sphingomonas vulcanisoli]|uniref:Cyclopropane-fatty-acyl-phospholipid synthase n=1 Tax=Sphingomonas vulcanisoli TaxID=1658060 RepID=A0ABX0TPG7_9SPHN|nr:cyclopropane-fatty-acyl-phospholipid synthase family protein [Sphingomonas vulcanisoli]NIJ07432.1 cyclopropane-fatty-acyl-phospholipid synthase [Sphingomonas vulcanisoli]